MCVFVFGVMRNVVVAVLSMCTTTIRAGTVRASSPLPEEHDGPRE